MNEEPATQISETAAVGTQPVPASTPPPQEDQRSGIAANVAAVAEEKPEVVAGTAFGAGFVLAMILRRLGS